MNRFYYHMTVNYLEIEVTNYCNAFCPDCSRNIQGGEINPCVKLEHMDFSTWKNIFTKKNMEHIVRVILNGDFGDCSMHPNLIEFLDYLSDQYPNIGISISTNGAARDTAWWQKLAQTLGKFDNHICTFAIDGLEDTNHIYRRGLHTASILKNLKAFNEAEGKSRWQFIVFDHNKHQIDQAESKAKELGCTAFITRRNRRQKPIKALAYKKLPAEIITAPLYNEFQKKYHRETNFKPIMELSRTAPESTDFSCPWAERRMIRINQNGDVWPCCFFSSSSITNPTAFNTKDYLENNSVNKHTLVEILAFFRNDLNLAWSHQSNKVCNNCLHKTVPMI